MADTIREKIMANLATALALITTGNGFNETIASVQRWEQDGNDFSVTPLIILAAGDETEIYGPDPLKTPTLNVELDMWTRHDKSVFTGSTDELINRHLGDIKKKVMEDITRGGNAQQTDVTGSIPFETTEGADFVGIMVQLEIQYRHNVNDPESIV